MQRKLLVIAELIVSGIQCMFSKQLKSNVLKNVMMQEATVIECLPAAHDELWLSLQLFAELCCLAASSHTFHVVAIVFLQTHYVILNSNKKRMHSSRMRTAHSSIVTGSFRDRDPLDRDPPQTETPLNRDPPGQGSPQDRDPPDRNPPGQRHPPLGRQTLLKTLSAPIKNNLFATSSWKKVDTVSWWGKICEIYEIIITLCYMITNDYLVDAQALR